MVDKFLRESVLAEKIDAEARVVLHRCRLSADELEALRSRGGLPVEKRRRETAQLEVNGLVVAEGVIVRKRGEAYFKITRMKED